MGWSINSPNCVLPKARKELGLQTFPIYGTSHIKIDSYIPVQRYNYNYTSFYLTHSLLSKFNHRSIHMRRCACIYIHRLHGEIGWSYTGYTEAGGIVGVWLPWCMPRLHIAWGSRHCWAGIFSAFKSFMHVIVKIVTPCSSALTGLAFLAGP